MNLLSILLKAFLSEGAVKALAKKTGISSKQLKKFLPLAVPLLLRMLTKNASSAEGAGSLLEALGQHTSEEPVEKQLAEADTVDGAKIIDHILGSGKQADVKELAAQAELDESDVSGLLSNIAPAVMTALSAATKSGKKSKKRSKAKFDLSDGLDLGDVMALLGGAKPKAGDLLGGLFGGKKAKEEDDPAVNGMSLLSYLLS